jgi:cobalt-zinc-cadmium efflux system outer membrane protein
MRTTLRLFLFVLLCLGVYTPAPGQVDGPLVLDSLVAEALRNNPQLRAARNKASASLTRVDQITSWESPQIGVEFYQTPIKSFPNPVKDWMENDYFIQQMIPFPGKLSAMGRAAENQAAMTEQEYRALQRKIIRDLKSAYFELYLVQRKIGVNAETQDLLRSFVIIARKQYEVAMGKQADVLRAQTELSTLVNAGISLDKEKRVIESMINTFLSRPPASPLGQVPDIEGDIPQWTFDQVEPLALENRAELKAMNYSIEMNKAEVTSAKREYLPDFMTKLSYKDMAKTKDDFWSFMVGVTIPLAPWSSGKYTSKTEETELNVKMAEDEYTSMKNMVLFDVQQALVNVQTNRNLVLLYKNTVIPQAEQTLQSTTTSYQTGKTEFLMLIDAYRMVLMSRLDYYMAVMNYMSSQAQLEQAVGLDLSDISARVH